MQQYKSKAYSMTMFSYNADKCLVHQRIGNLLHHPYDSWPKWSMLLNIVAAGWKFGKFGKISVIRQTKLVVTFWSIYSFAKLFLARIFIHPLLPNIIVTKLSQYTVLQIACQTEFLNKHHGYVTNDKKSSLGTTVYTYIATCL